MSTVLAPEIMLNKPKRKRKWIYGGAAVLIVLGAGTVFAAARANHGSTIPSSDIYPVGYDTVTQQIGVSGTIQSPHQMNLSFTGSGGVIKSVNVQVGQRVHAGQVLAALDDSSARTQLIQAQAAEVQAEGNLAQAQAKLVQAREGPTSAAIAVARSTVSKAQVALAGAKQQYTDQLALYNDQSSNQQQLLSQQATVNEQAAALQTARVNLQKAQLQTQQSLNGGTPEDITALQASVTAAQASLTTVQAQSQLSQQNLAILGKELQTAQTNLATDETTYGNPPPNALPNKIIQDQTAVDSAQMQYNSGLSAVDQNQTSLANAQASVANAQKTLADAQPTAGTNLGQQANLAVQIAQASLSQTQAQYNAAVSNLAVTRILVNDHTQARQSLDNARNAVTQNEVSLQSANASLAQTVQPPDPATIDAARAAVQTAQASVTSAQAALETAQISEKNTVLRAPVNGIITQSNNALGDVVSQGQAVFVLDGTGSSDLQMSLQVSESNVGQVKVGDPVAVTVSAYPNQTFTGAVTQIYPTPQVVNNVTEYTVLASVHNQGGELRLGMTTNVEMQVAAAKHVLTVPPIALQQKGTIEGVYVLGTRPAGSFRTGGFGGRGNGAGGSTSRQGRQGNGTGAGGSGRGTGGGFGAAGSGGTVGSRLSGSSGSGGGFAGLRNQLPKGVYFQPVQIGLFGTQAVQITSGLHAGEQIVLVLPGQTSVTSGTTTPGAQSGRGGGGGGGLFGGLFRAGGRG